MELERFRADLEEAPQSLARLAGSLRGRNPWHDTALTGRLVLAGMGSSHYAASSLAGWLRTRGHEVTAILASSDLPLSVTRDDTVVIISASGTSPESVSLAEGLNGRCRVIALTNVEHAPLHERVDRVLQLDAGVEVSGVASRSYLHTVALLLALGEFLDDPARPGAARVSSLVTAGARACADLLRTSLSWLPDAGALLLGPDGVAVVAPVSRMCSAQQSALMLREVPRRPAIACETGDWSHVDVYLTKTTDYRMLLLTGSPWQAQALQWCVQRGSTVVALGNDLDEAAMSIRHWGDDVPEVKLLSEVLVASLIADMAWRTQVASR